MKKELKKSEKIKSEGTLEDVRNLHGWFNLPSFSLLTPATNTTFQVMIFKYASFTHHFSESHLMIALLRSMPLNFLSINQW